MCLYTVLGFIYTQMHQGMASKLILEPKEWLALWGMVNVATLLTIVASSGTPSSHTQHQ